MDFLTRAMAMTPVLTSFRRRFHNCPEIGFDLPRTKTLIFEQLKRMRLSPQMIGKGSIVADLGPPQREGGVLLRADVDALAIPEEADVPFRATNGRMHGCGHDLHGAMLLGAAALLKEVESSLPRRVRLLFQPAEETLEGAADAISAGVCDGISSAYMLHVTVNTRLPAGTVILPPSGVIAPGADFFEITVHGKGCHGADPASGIDALSTAARILLGLQHLPSREFPSGARGALTVGALRGGEAFNVIPDRALLRGSLRCFEDDLRQSLKTRVEEISHSAARAFRARAEVSFPVSCPSLINDPALRNALPHPLSRALGKERIFVVDASDGVAGSEDFAEISRKVPAVMLALAAGDPGVSLHHPKIIFDEAALPYGAATLATIATLS